MSETDRIKLQTSLTETIDQWIETECESGGFYTCPEMSRMMAVAALAVLEASTAAEDECHEQ